MPKQISTWSSQGGGSHREVEGDVATGVVRVGAAADVGRIRTGSSSCCAAASRAATCKPHGTPMATRPIGLLVWAQRAMCGRLAASLTKADGKGLDMEHKALSYFAKTAD